MASMTTQSSTSKTFLFVLGGTVLRPNPPAPSRAGTVVGRLLLASSLLGWWVPTVLRLAGEIPQS